MNSNDPSNRALPNPFGTPGDADTSSFPAVSGDPQQDWYTSPPPFGQQVGQPRSPQGAPQKSPQRSPLFILIGLLLVLLIVAGITIGFLLTRGGSGFFQSDSAAHTAASPDAGVGSTTVDADPSAPPSSGPSTSADAARPRSISVPAGAIAANSAAQNHFPTGDFNSIWRGSSETSAPFAEAVRDAFVDFYLTTERTEGTISAYSSITGRYYDMRCSDNGDYVTCRGGNNAIVYIA